MISDKKILADPQDSFFKTSYSEEFSPPNDFKKNTYKWFDSNKNEMGLFKVLHNGLRHGGFYFKDSQSSIINIGIFTHNPDFKGSGDYEVSENKPLNQLSTEFQAKKFKETDTFKLTKADCEKYRQIGINVEAGIYNSSDYNNLNVSAQNALNERTAPLTRFEPVKKQYILKKSMSEEDFQNKFVIGEYILPKSEDPLLQSISNNQSLHNKESFTKYISQNASVGLEDSIEDEMD